MRGRFGKPPTETFVVLLFSKKKKKKTALNPCLWLAMPYEWGHAVHKSDFPISRLGYQISAIDTEHHTNSLHSNMEQLDGKHIKLTTVRNAVQLRPLEELCKLLPGSESIIGKNHCNMFFKKWVLGNLSCLSHVIPEFIGWHSPIMNTITRKEIFLWIAVAFWGWNSNYYFLLKTLDTS